MAYFGFTDKLVKGETIKIFNYGNCKRDFTYVDDIVEGVVRVMQHAPEKENGEDGLPIPPYKVYNIGICQLVQHEALDAATKGFKDTLTEKLGADKVKFDEQNAQGDSATCATICNQFVSSNYDLILGNGTAALQAAYTATPSIPILGTSITDYGTALDMAGGQAFRV